MRSRFECDVACKLTAYMYVSNITTVQCIKYMYMHSTLVCYPFPVSQYAFVTVRFHISGFLCPVHTPDGSPCGLLNHLAAACRVCTCMHMHMYMYMCLLKTLGNTPKILVSDKVYISH